MYQCHVTSGILSGLVLAAATTMPALLRCQCVCIVYRCNRNLCVNPISGEISRDLESPCFRAHQQAEAQQECAEQLHCAQSHILHRHKTELAERLWSVISPDEAVHDQPQPLSTTAQAYRTNRDRKLIDIISPIQQQCTALTEKLSQLSALTEDTSHACILIRQQELRSLLSVASPLATDLKAIGKSRALHGRSHSVKMLYNRTKVSSRYACW